MKRKPTSSKASSPLRRRAETRLREQLAAKHAGAGVARSPVDTQRLLHELQVHQVELEMQNEELRVARDEMEVGLEKYSELYDFAPVGYLTLDREGTIREANLTAASLLGIPRAPLVKRRLALFVAPSDRPSFNTFISRMFRSKERQECAVQLLAKDKPPVEVRIRGEVSASGENCRVTVSDITQHKQAEEKVRVSEIRYRRLFETAHDGVILLDPVTCKITDANPFMTKLLGYPREQLVGKELFEIGLLRDETASQAMFQKLTRKHEVRYEDLPLVSKTGRHQEVEVVANLYEENGHAVIQCNIRDITERKRTEHALRDAQSQLERYAGRLEFLVNERTKDLTATNRRLEDSVESIKQGNEKYRTLLLESEFMQKKLRQLTRQVLTAQEDERRKISRELHDGVVQTLVGINVQLSALGAAASAGVVPFQTKIADTQRLVEESVKVVHQFARELRPAVLDDLGLIPALHAYLKIVAERENLKINLSAFAGVEALDNAKRTVLYRVVQEALTNVVRHARASLVNVRISKIPGAVRLEVQDNGKSFKVVESLSPKTNQRLGLLGMRERIEMVGGTLALESAPGRGTTVRADIPFSVGGAA